MMDPEIPKNEGFFDQIKLTVPQGSVLNPHPSKPVSAGTHHPGADVGEVIAVAMQHVLPDKAVPQTYKTGIPTIIVGVDPRTGQSFTDHSAEVYAGWCNAGKGMDAWGAQNASFGNLWRRRRRSTRACTRTCNGAATTAWTPAVRASGAGCAAATTRRKCSSTPRCTRMSSG
jgi:hypothetical protein